MVDYTIPQVVFGTDGVQIFAFMNYMTLLTTKASYVLILVSVNGQIQTTYTSKSLGYLQSNQNTMLLGTLSSQAVYVSS